MKRLVLFFASLIFSLGLCGAVYGFEEVPAVYVDYEELEFPVEGEIIDGEAYFPIRTVLEEYLNRDIYFKDTSNGKLLIAQTLDGRFILNLTNGAYAYIISNYSYGVISLYDNTGENKMGVLSFKPFNKDGYTMLPVREVLEILDGEVNYDEELGQISVVSDTYRENIEYAGEPFPLVMTFSDLDIYNAEKLADCKGYEDFAEKCLEYYAEDVDLSVYDIQEEEDEETEDWNDYFDYDEYLADYYGSQDTYGEIITELFGYLYDLTDSDLMDGEIKTFLSSDFSDTVEINDDFDMEESVESIVRFMFNTLTAREGENIIKTNSEYAEAAKYVVLGSNFMTELMQIDYYSITEEEYKELEDKNASINLIYTYIENVYDQDFWDSFDEIGESISEEYEDELNSRFFYSSGGSYNMFTKLFNNQ
ncbi:MAG: copper amine oxidase N-terminal domain-containing protein [Clostridiales bacterium]|nr:copper amine oxidase N-terminal domain-containing protein [Clostridiales bacterium]